MHALVLNSKSRMSAVKFIKKHVNTIKSNQMSILPQATPDLIMSTYLFIKVLIDILNLQYMWLHNITITHSPHT